MGNMLPIIILLAIIVVLLIMGIYRRVKSKKTQNNSIIAKLPKKNKQKQKHNFQRKFGDVKFSIRPVVTPEEIWARNYMKDLRSQKQKSFFSKLEEIMQSKALDSVQVYKKAHIDRRLFSKLKKEDYHPRKKTVFALALAMELTLVETEELLLFSGYTFAPNRDFDLIIRDCIKKQVYDIIEVNMILYKCTKEML